MGRWLRLRWTIFFRISSSVSSAAWHTGVSKTEASSSASSSLFILLRFYTEAFRVNTSPPGWQGS